SATEEIGLHSRWREGAGNARRAVVAIYDFKTKLLQTGDRSLAASGVTCKDLLRAFFLENVQCLSQSENERRGGRPTGIVLFLRGALGFQIKVESPGLY